MFGCGAVICELFEVPKSWVFMVDAIYKVFFMFFRYISEIVASEKEDCNKKNGFYILITKK